MMKRTSLLLLVLFLVLILMSCQQQSEWRGFAEEDLSQYVTLGSYKGLSYMPADTAVDAEEIEEILRTRLEAITEWREVDVPITLGSAVVIDRYCFLNGVSTPSLSEEEGTYLCGKDYADAAVNGLLSQLIGKSKGDTAEYTVLLPEGYLSENSAETYATYRVTVRAVYERELPPLTDALAPKLVPGCQTLAECRASLKSELQNRKQIEENERIEAELRTALMAGVTVKEIPFDLYEEAYTEAYASYEMLAASSSISLEEYAAQYLGISREELEDRIDERVRAALSERLVLHAIAKSEGIEVSDKELRVFAEQAAAASQGMFANGDEYLDYFGTEQVSEEYLWEKVMSFLLSNALPR